MPQIDSFTLLLTLALATYSLVARNRPLQAIVGHQARLPSALIETDTPQ
jgi:hypothetical protein